MDALSDLARSSAHPSQTAARLVGSRRHYERWFYIAILAFTIGLAPIMAYSQTQLGFGMTIGVLLVGVVVVLMLRWPVLGFYALTICAVVVEQEALPYSIFTDHLYVFYWPTRLEGLPERPIGFFAIFIVLLVIVQRLAGRRGAPLRLGSLILPFLFLLACVAMGVAHGLASGGDLRIIVLEVRPFWYLFLNYLIAYNLITKKSHIIGFLWITVAGSFIKALQGVYIVMGPLDGHISGQNEIMAHEQSFFFILVLLLIVMCALLGRFRALLWVALISTPFLIVALLANNRRADYAAFLIGAVVAWVFVVAVRPESRKGLIVGMIVTALLFGGYVLAFQHSTGSFAEPAHAVVSIVHPSAADVRDQASNLYRYIEDYDLKFTEQQSPIIGYGFGRPYLEPIVLPNIISLDPYYLFIPHNTILWVWMRLGPIGYAALFYLLGAFVIRVGMMVRTLRDRDLQFVAIFGIAVVMIELPLAYGDYQLFFYRNIFYLGLLMGMLMRLPAIDRAQMASSHSDQLTDLDDSQLDSVSEEPQLVGIGAHAVSHSALERRAESQSTAQTAGAYLRYVVQARKRKETAAP